MAPGDDGARHGNPATMPRERAGLAREPEQRTRYGRLAALLFGAGALTTLPASVLLEPVPGPEILLITALGVASAIVCWHLPWERLPGWSLDAVTAAGTLEVLIVCHVVDDTYRLLYFVVVAFAALVLPTRERVLIQLVLVVLALVEPTTHDDGLGREHARIALLFAPVILIVAGTVRYLRETLESRERASRAFAREAIELAIRLRSGTPARDRQHAHDLVELEKAVERLR